MSMIPYSDIRALLAEFVLVKKSLELPELELMTKEGLDRFVQRVKWYGEGKLLVKTYLLALRDDGNEEARQLYQELLGAI